MAKSSDQIRNVVVIGQSKGGKTSLLEALLAKTKAIPRAGSVDDGSSILDHDDLEKERQHSIDPANGFFELDGVHVNVIDTPGYRDFIGHIFGPMSIVEAAIFVVDGVDGVGPYARKLWGYLAERNIPRLVVINRLDKEGAEFGRVLDQLQALDAKCIPLAVPVGEQDTLSGIEFTFGPEKGSSDLANEYSESFLEAVVESDEELLEKYFEGEEIPEETLANQVAVAVGNQTIFPVLTTSVNKDVGIAKLAEAIVKYVPPASNNLGRNAKVFGSEDEVVDLSTSGDDPLCGYIFRSISDPFVGKLSLVRVFSGELQQNGQFVNPHSTKTEKFGKIARLQGKDQVPVESVGAGDIVALLKLESLKNFDTLCSADKRLEIDPPSLPTPMYGKVLSPKTKTDEKKFGEALTKILDEDPGVVSKRDPRTSEMVVSAISQLHLLMVVTRLKSRYNVEVDQKDPKIPYLETINGNGDERYRHKKQSGGSGEFAEVALRVEPTERGTGFEFANEVFGGAISASYVQSVEKGIRAMLDEGCVAGYQMVDIKVTVYDGKEHPVDSKDVAFQKAGREAFRQAVNSAKPSILEPIVELEVSFPGDLVGDISGDLNRRRGRVQGMDAEGDFQVLKALVPLSELGDYSNALGAMTGGQGSFDLDLSHYEVTPGNIQSKVIEESKAEAKKED